MMTKGNKGGGGKSTIGNAGSGTLRAQLQSINASGRAMRKEAKADYNVALSASGAGQANLRQQLGLSTGILAQGQSRAVRATNRLADAARQSRAGVAAKQSKTVGMYGKALGQSVSESFGQARATAQAGVRVSNSFAAQSKGAAEVANQVAGLGRQEVAAQGQAAQYSLNQALMARNIVDATTLAQLKGDAYKTAMQYNMEWTMWKKQQQYATKQATKTQDNALVTASQSLSETAPTIAYDAWNILDSAAKETDGELDPHFDATAAAQQWATENGKDPAGAEAALMAATLANLKHQGTDPSRYDSGSAVQGAITSVFGGMKNWDSVSGSILSSANAGTHAEFHNADLRYAAEQADATDAKGNRVGTRSASQNDVARQHGGVLNYADNGVDVITPDGTIVRPDGTTYR